jgi:hypothetical protein
MRAKRTLTALVSAVALSTAACSDGGGDQQVAPTTTTPTTTSTTTQQGPDLSTPEAAAKTFVAAAGSEDLVDLSCVGHLPCVAEHAPDADDAQIAAAQDTIREGTFELAEHLKGAEFGTAVDGAVPGSKDVPYRTPAMDPAAKLTLTFVQSDGKWLYYGQGV